MFSIAIFGFIQLSGTLRTERIFTNILFDPIRLNIVDEIWQFFLLIKRICRWFTFFYRLSKGIIQLKLKSFLLSSHCNCHFAVQTATIILNLLIQLIKIVVASEGKLLENLTFPIYNHTRISHKCRLSLFDWLCRGSVFSTLPKVSYEVIFYDVVSLLLTLNVWSLKWGSNWSRHLLSYLL